jgi:hypothetical protein
MCIFLRGQLTVFFETPYWVGIFERVENGALAACKVTFGAEPSTAELYAFIMAQSGKLAYGEGIAEVHVEKHINPKRLQREVHRQMSERDTRSKAQAVISAQYEAQKELRRKVAKERRAEIADARYALKQLQKKQKKRGC